MERQLREAQNERDQLRGRVDNMQQARSAAENDRDESVARVAELERSLHRRHEQLREDAERCSVRLQQVKAVLTAYISDGFETDSESDVAEGVRCLVQSLQDKSAVCCCLHYYLIIVVLLSNIKDGRKWKGQLYYLCYLRVLCFC